MPVSTKELLPSLYTLVAECIAVIFLNYYWLEI